MARQLDEEDIRILRILAPESEELICSGSGVEFRSILPPVANHYSRDEEDFRQRLLKLSGDDLTYLIGKMRSGEESVACMPPEHAVVLATVVDEKVGRAAAEEVITLYETMDEC